MAGCSQFVVGEVLGEVGVSLGFDLLPHRWRQLPAFDSDFAVSDCEPLVERDDGEDF